MFEADHEANFHLPDIHRPRSLSVAAAAAPSVSAAIVEPEPLTTSVEAAAATEKEPEASAVAEVRTAIFPCYWNNIFGRSVSRSSPTPMSQAASPPAAVPAPTKKEKFKLNFKFDFTKVNFKKKAEEKVVRVILCPCNKFPSPFRLTITRKSV